jgi:DNA replication protein DnaC
MHPNQETLPILLKQLNLPYIYNNWEEASHQAEKEGWQYSQYLATLADHELTGRRQRRLESYIRASGLHPGKTLDSLDLTKSPSINAAQITTLSNNIDWVKKAENLIIFGPSGVGKTHLASAIGYRLIEKGIRTLFTPTTALVQKLQQERRDYKLADYLNKLAKYDLLILDDIGYVKKDEGETSVLFELIAHRYESHSLIITSNQSFKEWDKIFPDNVMAVAAIDRLVHHSTIINITDESFRRRHSMQQQ